MTDCSQPGMLCTRLGTPSCQQLDKGLLTLLHAACTDLMEGSEGFDSSHALWKSSGWREVRHLRQRLQELKELRELVRSLGRSGGKGPLRRAPEQVASPPVPAQCRYDVAGQQELPSCSCFGEIHMPGLVSNLVQAEAAPMASLLRCMHGGEPLADSQPSTCCA